MRYQKASGAAVGLAAFMSLTAVEAKANIDYAKLPGAPRSVALAGAADSSPATQEARLRCLPFCTTVGSQGRARVQDHRPPPHQGRPPRRPR